VRAESYRDTRGPGRRGVRLLLDEIERPGDRKALRDHAALRLLHVPVPACYFCGREPATSFALTARDATSWRREVLPVCLRCHRELAQARQEGRRLKATGERWWLGHTGGRFGSRGAPKPR
jgi:hypothetical protein